MGVIFGIPVSAREDANLECRVIDIFSVKQFLVSVYATKTKKN